MSFYAFSWKHPVFSGWRHGVETLFALLSFCVGNPPSRRPEMWKSVGLFFARLKKLLEKRLVYSDAMTIMWRRCIVFQPGVPRTKISRSNLFHSWRNLKMVMHHQMYGLWIFTANKYIYIHSAWIQRLGFDSDEYCAIVLCNGVFFVVVWRWYRTGGYHYSDVIMASQITSLAVSTVTSEFPAQRPVTRSFDIFFDLRLKRLIMMSL